MATDSPTPASIDLKKRFPKQYRPPTSDFVDIDVAPMTYLAVDGSGDPNTSDAYSTAVQMLYTVAYATRAALKQRTGLTFVVGPLEGLWTSSDPAAFVARDKSRWEWTMLIGLPAEVSTADTAAALSAAAKKNPQLPLDAVKSVTLHEGRCLQIMHIGSYDDEAPTLARLHTETMPGLGVTFNGAHHEIYLSDPRRTAPEKLKTILRQPVG